MPDDHKDPRLPSDRRARALLDILTLDEKCAQLVGVWPWKLVTPSGRVADGAASVLAAPPGHVSGLTVDDPRTLARLVAAIQEQLVQRTRAGIPALVHAEALNGFLAGGHEVYPTPTALASTWSPELVQEMADRIRTEMLRAGVRQALSPVLDVAVDARWGRVHETYGEDPYLSAAMGVAYVRGLQSSDLRDGVVATAKHFLAYGLPECGLNLSASDVGPRRLRDVYAYPFEAAIQLAGLRSVMNSYADVDGIPVGASRAVLTDLLRGTLGFTGFVSSDYTTTQHLVERQRVAADAAEASRLAVTAGLDVELPAEYAYGSVLAEQVRGGAVPEADVDACAERVLRVKFDLGLFEDPYPRQSIQLRRDASATQTLSSELARRSVVLLRNDGTLPLTPQARVLLVGPHATTASYQFPTYTFPAWREMITRMHHGELGHAVGVEPVAAAWHDALFPLQPAEELVRERYNATALADELASRCDVLGVEPGCTLLDCDPHSNLDAVRTRAEDADVVVLALGGASLWFNGERTEGEGSDSADVALPAAQVTLVKSLAATGTPMVVVLFQGRGYALPPEVLEAAAVVVAPYGGPCGPKAVAEVLLGTIAPSGKLPYSIPRHSGHLPVYHHQRNGSGHRQSLAPGVNHHYLDMPASPTYPFGYGLSYTQFEVGDLAHDRVVDVDGALRVSARINNTGSRAGDAVVQLYLQLRASGVTRPSQQLAGFTRVSLDAGASAVVTFTIEASQMGCTDVHGDFSVGPGSASLFVGLHAEDRTLAGEFEIVGALRRLRSADRSFLSRAVVEPETP